MRNCSSCALVSMVVAALLAGCATAQHPTLGVLGVFDPLDTDVYYVEPYAINLYSIYMLRHDLSYAGVERYIDWYFNNLNYPDKHGLTGSIYDYTVYRRGGRQVSSRTYDSVDAYAGTFLWLLWEYYQRTGERELLDQNRFKILDIAYLILHLQDEDGLARAVPELSHKYLMDNCENYGGLVAFVELSRALGWDDPVYYDEAAQNIRRGVLTKLEDPERGLFLWAVDDLAVHRSRWDTFYPDAYAQIFPLLYGIVDPRSERGRLIWEEFSSRYDPRRGFEMETLQQLVVNMTREKMLGL